jgi:uncharacterized protein DUF6378
VDESQFRYGKSAPIADTIGLPTPPAKPASGEHASGEHAHGILTEAAAIVRGDRNMIHGDKDRSFAVIAELWTTYLRGRAKFARGEPIHAIDVAQMMVLMKIARSIQEQPIRDHFTDQCRYSAIAGELAAA